MFFHPRKDTTGKFNEIGRRNNRIERLKQILHDRLKQMEFDIVRYLILSLSGNGLIGFHDLVVIILHDLEAHHFFPQRRQLLFLLLLLKLKKLINRKIRSKKIIL